MASISKTRRGKYVVRIRREGFPAVSKQFETLKEAQAFGQKTESEMYRGRFVDLRPAESTTLKAAINDYIVAESSLKRGARAEILRLKKIARDQCDPAGDVHAQH